MAIVLALLIVGWLVAFALGSQAGFENEVAAPNQSANSAVAQESGADATAYRGRGGAEEGTRDSGRTKSAEDSVFLSALCFEKVCIATPYVPGCSM